VLDLRKKQMIIRYEMSDLVSSRHVLPATFGGRRQQVPGKKFQTPTPVLPHSRSGRKKKNPKST
jgi:hypothetical protein